MKRNAFFLVTILVVATGTFTARAAEGAAVRALSQRYADAIIGVELVVTVKVKMGEREAPPREQRVEVNGTVISADGLTVTSLAEVDPEVAIEAMRAGRRGGPQIELLGADFKEVKLRLADGTEVPARFVLKDQDLDLAFMAPEAGAEEGKREFAHVDLANRADGALFDEFYFVSRAPKVLQRVPLLRSTQVMGVVQKPRRFYLVTEHVMNAPAFDVQGRVLGISLQHFANSRRTGLVILPAEDIAEVAKQAAAAQHAPKEVEKTAADSSAGEKQ